MQSRLLTAGLMLATHLAAGCSMKSGGCAKGMIALPDSRFSGVVWGGDDPIARAFITRVSTECFAVGEGSETGVMVEIPVTAAVVVQVEDKDRLWGTLPRTSAAVAEAFSANGVILGSSETEITLRETDSEQRITTSIRLYPEAAARVTRVTVRWLYR